MPIDASVISSTTKSINQASKTTYTRQCHSALGLLAACHSGEGNLKEALDTAKLGLLIDPENDACQLVLRDCERDAPQASNDARAVEQPVTEQELWRAAEARPSDIDAVEAWFSVATNPQAVVDFYNAHSKMIPPTAWLYCCIAENCEKLYRWNDVVESVDATIRKTEVGEQVNDLLHILVGMKSNALCELSKPDDAVRFAGEFVSRFPNDAWFHRKLSDALLSTDNDSPSSNAMSEAVKHTEISLSLEPQSHYAASHASYVSSRAHDSAAALKYAQQALTLASNDEEKVDALMWLAFVFFRAELWKESRKYLQQVLKIDEHNIEAVDLLASCYFQEDNLRETSRWARLGLMLNPENESCREMLDFCDKYSKRST